MRGVNPINHNFRQIWKVAATFIGTTVGAGFASGQEILKFFSHFGAKGIIGIVISTFLFCLTGTFALLLGQRLEASSFGEVIRHVCGKRLGLVMDLLLSLFLFGTLSVMIAGSGAVFFQQWGLPYWVGTITTFVLTIVTVLYGMKGIIGANSLVVPFMIFFCILATWPAVSMDRLTMITSDFQPSGTAAAPNWLLSALLYVSYNITLGISVLAPLGKEIKNRRQLIWGGIIGGLTLGILALFINLAILSHYPTSAEYEIPSLFIAGKLAPLIQWIFSFVLWAEIFTTVIGTVYGLAVRITPRFGMNYMIVTFILMVLALGCSQFGFSDLVGTLYPLFGYFSLIFLIQLLISPRI